ncbi:hypothetical protein [Micromonospora sp. DT47]|uniref:hypothetical protein n=1 Tax=Micromonospora sp. DT47 TaxID=3393431 RepID=UPI003CF39BB3
MVLLVAAWVVGALLMFMSAMGLSSTVLAQRGEQVEATVISLRDGTEKGRHIYYTLADPDGRRISGELGTWPGSTVGASDNPEGRVGQSVTVIRDPKGLVDPRLPEEVDAEATWIAWLFFFVVTAVLCALAGRPRVARRGWQGWRRAEAHAGRVELIRHHLTRPDEWWQNADREQRAAYVQDLLAPLRPSDKLLAELTSTIGGVVTATDDSNGDGRDEAEVDK